MVFILIAVTVIVSFMAFSNQELMRKLIFNPYMIQTHKQWYRFITSGFIHADPLHLFVNMFVMYSFGTAVEQNFQLYFEEKAYYYLFLLYFGGMITSVLPTFKRNQMNPGYNALGASGAVASLLFSFILFEPMQKIYIFALVPIPAIVFGILYIVYCQYMDRKGGDNVNHSAHLWGSVFGFIFTILLEPSIFSIFLQKLIYFRNAI
ncbi:MAG: rhomboid family intramembrane serine protease [Bacteroidetes bacterium]|nr:rhomboid family intramembrane serine protease [Bacteroidota bacterium]